MEQKNNKKNDDKVRATSAHYDEKELVMDDAIEYNSKTKEAKQISTKEIKKEDKER